MFEWNGAKISARELTIGDEEQITMLLQRLTSGATRWTGGQYAWAEFQVAADVKGEPPIPLATGDEEQLQGSFEAWLKLPRRFLTKWRAELNQVEGSPNG